MKLRHFDYRIPEHLIAQHPLQRRDQARLMAVDRHSGEITHNIFANLQRYLPLQSCLVLNDTKVIPARLLGRRATGADVEIFLLKKLADGYSYETLMRPLNRLNVGEQIAFNGGSIIARIEDKEKRIVRFNRKNLRAVLNKVGHMPLPPYIKRPDVASDRKDYQTVYAKQEGSVAAPTAGLHFTKAQLGKLKRQGHQIEHVTLHVNYGTFKPVEAEDITRHPMHVEDYAVTRRAYMAIQKAKSAGHKIVAVGTTSCRVLETVARTHVLQGETNLFVYPGIDFKMADILVTNFHLPRSTLLMLVYAFGGMGLMKKAYREAIKAKYRFYSYGDAMIIL
jgi:S-adenosylmethionine:tRNA ribosyltransferase-isomerase